MTAGSCVDIDKNIISNYKRNYKGKSIINLGTPGSLPLFELIKLKEYVYSKPNYKKPKKIYWLYYEGNDLRELNNFYKGYKSTYISNYLNDPNFSQKLKIVDDQRNEELNKSLNYAIGLIEKKMTIFNYININYVIF